MARKLTDAEIARRCTCGAPLADPSQHRRPCLIATRHYNRDTTSRARRQTAVEVAAAFRAGLAYLRAGGRPHG